jgi:hypothetical protein
MSCEHGVVVTGGHDGFAMVWDLLSTSCLHVLGPHKASLCGVGVNRSCGDIYTLTSRELRVWGPNGVLIHRAEISSFQLSAATTLAVPACPDWLDSGVVAITGHQSGALALWRLSIHSVATETTGAGSHGRGWASTEQPSSSAQVPSWARGLMVVQVLTKAHGAAITALRVWRTKSPSAVVSYALRKNHDMPHDGGCVELIAGDAAGYVSRWASASPNTLTAEDLEQSRAFDRQGDEIHSLLLTHSIAL